MSIAPPAERDETLARVEALSRYHILDTPTESDFDDIVRLAAEAFAAPIAVVNFIASERQWFKAEVGIGARELPLDVSICSHALLEADMMVIPDTRLDARFAENPLVTIDGGLRFYAGALLRTPEDIPIGTVCVLDRQPRPDGITPFQKLTLEILARQVMTQLDLRRALAQRRDDERRYRLILDSALDYAIVTMDLCGRVTSWNQGAFQITGWSEREMCGRPCDDFFTPEDRLADVPAQEMGAALAMGRGADDRWHMKKDGSRFWASGELMPLTDDENTPIGFLKILRDRTEWQRSMKKLEESETRVRLALEAGELGAWESSPSLRELRWDARTRELLGHHPDEPLDYEMSFLSRVHPDDREHVIATNAGALGSGGDGTTDMEYRIHSAVDGKERWVHAKGALSIGADGQSRFVGTVRDITAQKDAEAHRILLTGELEHRIKNTLAVVQSIVSQSLRGVATPEEARDAIGERLTTLAHAHDLLTRASWTAAPMALIVEGATRLHGAKPGRILIDGPDLLLSAKAALAFSMSFHELSTNAAKYGALSNEIGHVELTWRIEKGDHGDRLEMRWQEYGGPSVNPPKRKGFGSRLMIGLEKDMGGVGELDFSPSGVAWTLIAELERIKA